MIVGGVLGVILIEILVLVVFVYAFMVLICESTESNDGTLSMYECGFDSSMGSRVSFSYRFFLISILFLVFDVEVTLLVPIPYISGELFQMVGVFVFMMVLLMGLLYEYYNGVLSWIKVENS